MRLGEENNDHTGGLRQRSWYGDSYTVFCLSLPITCTGRGAVRWRMSWRVGSSRILAAGSTRYSLSLVAARMMEDIFGTHIALRADVRPEHTRYATDVRVQTHLPDHRQQRRAARPVHRRGQRDHSPSPAAGGCTLSAAGARATNPGPTCRRMPERLPSILMCLCHVKRGRTHTFRWTPKPLPMPLAEFRRQRLDRAPVDQREADHRASPQQFHPDDARLSPVPFIARWAQRAFILA